MKIKKIILYIFLVITSLTAQNIQLGVRPYYLVDKLEDSILKEKLSSCKDKVFKRSDFSISHRGAPLQFAEHTKESYEAAIRMGAGIMECDVVSTKDNELVCRHSECDLHSTTNILLTPLAKKCTQSFIPFDASTNTQASAKCCTSDISLEEFYTLSGKMDSSDVKATNVEDYVDSTPKFRTNLYANDGGTLMSHKDSIELFKTHHLKMVPEIKTPDTKLIDKLVKEYIDAGVKNSDIFVQSFNLTDLVYIIKMYPQLAENLIYLQEEFDKDFKKDIDILGTLKQQGIRIIAPPLWALVKLDNNKKIVPSNYAKALKKYGFKIITWSLERSKITDTTKGGWYYQSISEIIDNNSYILELLYVLDKEVGIIGAFSDWPATVTFYKNCIE